jgi:hypothetical protein
MYMYVGIIQDPELTNHNVVYIKILILAMCLVYTCLSIID